MPTALDRISLRAKERGFVVGGTDTGKSTLAEALIADWCNRYPSARVLILDSKPRFRAERDAHGRPLKRRYRSWDHGPVVPGSVAVGDPAELDMAWRTNNRVVIAQDEHGGNIAMLVGCAREFLKSSRAGRPQLLVVDETMDFYSSNGAPRGGDDVLTRVARAGRERGTSGLFCSQRTKGIPGQLMEELTKCYLFRLDYRTDVKRLYEMGFPEGVRPPGKKRVFLYWTKAAYDDVWGPYSLDLARR